MNKLEIIQKLDEIDNLLKFEFENYGASEQPHLTVWDDSDLTTVAGRHHMHLIREWLKEIANAIEEEKIYG